MTTSYTDTEEEDKIKAIKASSLNRNYSESRTTGLQIHQDIFWRDMNRPRFS